MKTPLTKREITTVTIQYKNREKEIHLYKEAIGKPRLTAKGTVMRSYFFSKSFKSKVQRFKRGIKDVTVTTKEVSDEEYFNSLLSELDTLLHKDMYWYDTSAGCTQKLYERVTEVLDTVGEEDIDIEIPELVTYFYNFLKPKTIDYTKDLKD